MTRSDDVARRILAERKRQGLTREDLAHSTTTTGLSLTAAMLVNIETGRPGTDGNRRRCITVDELAVLSEALGVPEARLLGADGCAACGDEPPAGFACLTCDKEGRA